MEKNKENLIKSLKIHIDFVRTKIKDKLEMIKIIANRSLKELARLAPEDQMVYMNLRASAQTRVVELNHLDSSPYFVKCDVLNEKNERKTYFFSNFTSTISFIVNVITTVQYFFCFTIYKTTINTM